MFSWLRLEEKRLEWVVVWKKIPYFTYPQIYLFKVAANPAFMQDFVYLSEADGLDVAFT